MHHKKNLPVHNKWQFFIDRGGTFTDIIAKSPNGDIIVKKILSDNPDAYSDAAIFGIKQILSLSPQQKIPARLVAAIKIGTTVATNALLERKGEKTALITTNGFTDILRIAGQQRPDIFALEIIKPDQLYDTSVPIIERIDVNGHIITPLDEIDAIAKLKQLYKMGFRTIAVVFMHSIINNTHEKKLRDIAKKIGFNKISLSHIVSPLVRIVPRGDTTVISAYLSPILHRYIKQLKSTIEPGIELLFMQSNGGLTTPPFFHGENALLSGPAGGVIGATKIAQATGFNKMISFDMGGTSTDTAHFIGNKNNSDYEKTFNTTIAGARIQVPMLKVETLAAGGGSICDFDGTVMTVGPHSAGSNPGPACYGRGGPLTITDCHIMLGRLQPHFFPSIFGHNHHQSLDTDIVNQKFLYLANIMKKKPEDIALGFLKIANEKMAAGIKKISIAMGHDTKDHLLVGFGGNGGQHVCAIADILHINHILLHPLAGVLSALGISMAAVSARREKSLNMRLTNKNLLKIKTIAKQLTTTANNELTAQYITASESYCHLYCRYSGSDVTLPLVFTLPLSIKKLSPQKIFNQFQKQHQQKFDFSQKVLSNDIIIDLITITLSGQNPSLGLTPNDIPHHTETKKPLFTTAKIFLQQKWQTVPLLSRTSMKLGDKIFGPAIITENTSTNFIADGWQATLLKNDSLLLKTSSKIKKSYSIKKISYQPDPINLEIFNNRFMTIAEQMGVTLQNTAFSVNIKERLDFSCAIFDHNGNLIANAPHIPVHLGSMADSVRYLIAIFKKKKQNFTMGDSFLTNSPYHGGTHLPDMTVISPIFIDKKLTFFIASRGHHTDVGGLTPGSMPAYSKNIIDEGILIDHFHLVKKGILKKSDLTKILINHRYPVRNLEQNFSDIHAQLAANKQGMIDLIKMCAEHGRVTTKHYVNFSIKQATNEVKKVISQLRDGQFTYQMDNGAVIKLTLTINKKNQTATIDFTGTSDQQSNNFNAPFAIVKSVLLYVFRTLIDKKIPLNEGCLAPIKIIVPNNSMLNPQPPAAVVAGNVETSQVIADALYGAMGIMAACQGTMNNLTFGNKKYQYYETIAGGSGAGQKLNGYKFHGADAVHSHMTNSRMTDPEIMESRYPVRIIEYTIRQKSGGGRHQPNNKTPNKKFYHGGNGFTKRILFLESVTLNILANHRIIPPFGLNGGEAGQVGENYIEHSHNNDKIKIDYMTATDTRNLMPGDIFTIHTPGGGEFIA
ncbi:MAG: hydantoinase B/oxoprolinase family protein [Alphaproteobacteria bacterium]